MKQLRRLPLDACRQAHELCDKRRNFRGQLAKGDSLDGFQPGDAAVCVLYPRDRCYDWRYFARRFVVTAATPREDGPSLDTIGTKEPQATREQGLALLVVWKEPLQGVDRRRAVVALYRSHGSVEIEDPLGCCTPGLLWGGRCAQRRLGYIVPGVVMEAEVADHPHRLDLLQHIYVRT